MKPPSILDPKFHYIPANSTDLRKTFNRIRRQMGLEEAKARAPVVPIKTGRKAK